MSREHDFSDEFLNAFVDDQLEADEKGRVYTHLNQDEGIKRQVCELRTLRELVQFAYKVAPQPVESPNGRRLNARRGFGVAAAVTLVLGFVVGWALHQQLTVVTAPELARANIDTAVAGSARTSGQGQSLRVASNATPSAAPAADHQIVKVLIHFNGADKADAKQTLDDLEGMMKYYRAHGQIARVELVVNGDGLDLLRADTSPFAERILRMQNQYDGLAFVACKNTIDRLERERGIVARLLPGVAVIDSGVAQMMRRQHQGWAYIQA